MASESLQGWLIDWQNPLKDEKWKQFFADLPASCGIYHFKSGDGKVLYVGQSKSLKNRLKSYRYVHPDRSPRKLCRLVQEVSSIEYEPCSSWEKTKVLEAKRIHELRPKHNRVFTHPESNRFLGFKIIEQDRWQWSLLTDPVVSDPKTRVFGAFSGTAVRTVAASLQRTDCIPLRKTLVSGETRWGFFDAMVPDQSVFETTLERNLTHSECERLVRKLIDFLEGKNDSWLHRTFGKNGMLIQQCPDPWVRDRWERDYAYLQSFFKFQTKRNRTYAANYAISRKNPIDIKQLDLLKARTYGAT